MPVRPPRVCNRCRKTVPARKRCPCSPAWTSSRNSYTGSGSTRRWRRVRAAKLAADPVCERPGCRRLAVEVDHIIRVSRGGDRYDPANLQSLCHEHHQDKTLVEAQDAKGQG
ncbi:HNH endonuclease signature motif containing protein [Nocardia neocaledoniensis]|uniref:HNH endonuclease signature motif containing protein n=1 Tax=Nocardia neocaledoniensis TaxID=236511 RepID=UPI0024546A2D|nr:HNH endonuclease signature motif containing protein [Nocardia neocaledoniensis]